jgi:pteridine reductase
MHDAYDTSMSLSGKVVLVTGAARRVGRAIAEELARAGATVAIHHRDSDADAASLHASLPGSIVLKEDLRDPLAPARLVAATVKSLGRLDLLVNSAAGYARTPLAALADDEWDAMLALNLTAPMRLIRAGVPAGVRAIVNIVDVGAWQPWPNYLAYSTSKAGLLHLTRCLALELAPAVRVNAVAPGTVAFPQDWSDDRRARQTERIPLKRVGEVSDVARAVRFLMSEEYLTGVCLPVDGGSGLR